MKIATNATGADVSKLNGFGVVVEEMNYATIFESRLCRKSYDLLVIDISDAMSHGVSSPYEMVQHAHTLPVIGIVSRGKIRDQAHLQSMQAEFIAKGGIYLLIAESDQNLLIACMERAIALMNYTSEARDQLRKTYSTDSVELQVNMSTATTLVNGDDVHLTIREFDVLRVLLERPGEIISKENIMNRLDYTEADQPRMQIIDVYICKFRKKLGPASVFVKNVRGRGYIFHPNG